MRRLVASFGWVRLCSLVLLFACDGDAPVVDGGDDPTMDAGGGETDGGERPPAACETDAECSDGQFCTGVERCAPSEPEADAAGCVAATSPCNEGFVCDEGLDECIVDCGMPLDADGDGHRSIECGGDDCDDDDTNRYPGSIEVCDGEGRDEDCNPETFGFLDADGDGSGSSSCCNGINCGDDCNDADSTVNARAGDGPPLYCDGVDNDCSTTADEGCPCVEGETRPCGTPAQTNMIGLCRPGTQVCSGGEWTATCIGGVSTQVEACDGEDNDCDGNVDNGVLRTYVADADGDGFGASGGAMVSACSPPAGYAPNDTDCDDAALSRNPLATEVCNGVDDDCDEGVDEGVRATFYQDGDGDGFGNATVTVDSCSRPSGHVDNGSDCDDSRRAVNPPAAEVCDEIDNNCDASIDDGCTCTDGDTQACGASDGMGGIVTEGECFAGSQRCAGGIWGVCTGAREPVSEACNGKDDDCDGQTDEGVETSYYRDADGDGFGTATTTIAACAPPTGYSLLSTDCDDAASGVSPSAAELCDARDNNCTGGTDEGCSCTNGDTQQCGSTDVGACAFGEQLCVGGLWGSCVGAVGPAASESCNGADDDCDTTVDEGVKTTFYLDDDGDGFGTPLMTTLACEVPSDYSRLATDCDDAAAGVNPAAPETCDARDNNCASGTDEGCDCVDGATRACGSSATGACRMGSQLCIGGRWGTCAGSVEPTAETCNAADDDCDGGVDENVQTSFYRDADGDGFGTALTTSLACEVPMGYSRLASDCDDGVAGVSPAATETCDGADNNCTGGTDEGCDCVDGATRTCGTSSTGVCRTGSQLCIGGLWGSCAGNVEPTVETCNGADDDCDGSTDELLLVTCYSDNDDDGYASVGAPSDTFCPVAGRAAEGGCPIYWTNRAPGATPDCADDEPRRSPGRTETCNGVDDDCDPSIDETTASECAAANGFGACLDGACGIVGCAPGRGDCDGAIANGCEANTRNDADNCGGCGVSCAGGRCQLGTCESVVGIDGGDRHTCAWFTSGRASCWGENNSAQLGDGGSTDRGIPAGVSGLTGASHVAAGGFHTCARKGDGTVQCWGRNSFGEVGGTGSDISTPRQVAGLSNVQQVATGQYFSCARSSGSVSCWGYNDQGQLGAATPAQSATPLLVPGITTANGLYLGSAHACVIRGAAGNVSCWGDNGSGQLGNGMTTDSPTPVNASMVTGVAELALGSSHTCARLTNGEVRCWGAGGGGQLGHGMNFNSLTPVQVTAATGAIALVAGGNHNCALMPSGQVMCWGRNDDGQLGNEGIAVQSNNPVPVTGLDDAVAIGAGASHTCAVRQSGRVVCWGQNIFRQIGDGSVDQRDTPVNALGIADVVQVSALGSHVCARHSTGRLACWGSNFYGQLGDDTTDPRNRPVAVSGSIEAIDAAVSSDVWSSSCAIDSSGQGWCWGSDSSDQLGNESVGANSRVPVMVTGLDDAVRISADLTSCAVRENQEVDCWGEYLGAAPVTVSGIADAIDISSGVGFRCVLRASGRVSCWGLGEDGQTGTGNPIYLNNTPTDVVGLTDAIDLATGDSHACALRSSGVVMCWGANTSGQVGDGTFVQRNTPVQVVGLDQVVELEAGQSHTCARRISGEVRCWGENGAGQVGDGSTTDRLAPVSVVGLGVAREIAAGAGFTCVRLVDQRVGCFGDNTSGQLGDGTNDPAMSWTPVVGL